MVIVHPLMSFQVAGHAFAELAAADAELVLYRQAKRVLPILLSVSVCLYTRLCEAQMPSQRSHRAWFCRRGVPSSSFTLILQGRVLIHTGKAPASSPVACPRGEQVHFAWSANVLHELARRRLLARVKPAAWTLAAL